MKSNAKALFQVNVNNYISDTKKNSDTHTFFPWFPLKAIDFVSLEIDFFSSWDFFPCTCGKQAYLKKKKPASNTL